MVRTSLERRRFAVSSGYVLIAVGLLCVFAGLRHHRVGAFSLGVALVLVPLAVRLALGQSLRAIRLTRLAPGVAFEGDTVPIEIRLENGSRWPLFQPLVSDRFKPELHALKLVPFLERVCGHESVTLGYEGDCLLPRGLYSFGPLELELSDPLGWFTLERIFPAPGRLKVYPAVRSIGGSDKTGQAMTSLLNRLTRRGPGRSDEFFAVRDYRRGDPLRSIHWRLTAHRGTPVVRQFTKPSTGDLHIFVDRDREGLLGVGRGSSLEHAVKVAAAAASRALTHGHRVALWAGLDRAFRVAPGGGRDFLPAILDVLVRLKPSDEASYPELLESVDVVSLQGGTALLLLGPHLLADDRIYGILEAWRRRSVRVLAVVFDATSFRQLYRLSESHEPSEELRARLRRMGFETWLLPCASDLDHLLTAS